MAAEHGAGAVHALMCSDHAMVRRAACEVFCNMPLHPGLLKLLRHPHVKLWLILCQDGAQALLADDDEEGEAAAEEDVKEAVATARAASGTLAMATADPHVCAALLRLDDEINTDAAAGGGAKNLFGRATVALLRAQDAALAHRALVMVLNLLTVDTDAADPAADADATLGKIGGSAEAMRRRAARALCEAGVLPAVGAVLQVGSRGGRPWHVHALTLFSLSLCVVRGRGARRRWTATRRPRPWASSPCRPPR